jgi:hypothetical protein
MQRNDLTPKGPKGGEHPNLFTGTKFPISGIQAFSVCFYEYLVLPVYDVVMSHLSGGLLFFENTNSMVKGLWLAVCLPWQRRDRGRPDVVIVIGTGRKVRIVQAADHRFLDFMSGHN